MILSTNRKVPNLTPLYFICCQRDKNCISEKEQGARHPSHNRESYPGPIRAWSFIWVTFPMQAFSFYGHVELPILHNHSPPRLLCQVQTGISLNEQRPRRTPELNSREP